MGRLRRMRYYISPFLNSHSFHLIVGDARVGKTAYALQTAAMLLPDAIRPDPSPDGHSYAWGNFLYGPRLAPEETIWYVECFRPRYEVLEKCRILRVPVVGEVSEGVCGLNVLTVHEVADSRNESARAGPVTFEETINQVRIRNGGNLPSILIVDGISGLLVESRENKHQSEMQWFRDISRTYLERGGTLIGVQTFSQNHRVPGIVTANSTPGTFAFSGAVRTVSEMRYRKGKTMRNRRDVDISGTGFSTRRLALEFIEPGILAPALVNEEGQPMNRVADQEKLNVRSTQEIVDVAVTLSVRNNGQFNRKELAELCAVRYEIPLRTIERWLTEARVSKLIIPGSVRGWYRFAQVPIVAQSNPTIN